MNNKILLKIVVILGLAILFAGCCDSTQESTQKEAIKIDKANVLKTVLNVEGMTCEGCESAIQGNLSKLDGVVSVKASYTAKTTIIEYDKSQITKEELEKAIVDTGYKIIIPGQEKALKVAPPSAMKCGEGKCGASMNEKSE